MEGGTIEQDEIEIEKLLREIPHATLGNPHAGESIVMGPSLELKSFTVEVDKNLSPSTNITSLCSSSQAAKVHSSMALYGSVTCPKSPFDQKIQSNSNLENTYGDHIASITNIEQGMFNLPAEHSLASAFEELSINPTSLNHRLLLDGQSPIHLNKSLLQLKSVETSVPPLPTMLNRFNSPATLTYSPFMIASEANRLSGNLNVQDDERFSKLNELKKQRPGNLVSDFGERRQNIPLYSWPVNPAMHAFQFLPETGFDGLESPASAFQQQYYLDGQSLAYMHPQNISWPNMVWRNLDAERYCRMNEQYFQLEQLQNQGPQVCQISKGMKSAIGPLNANRAQPYFEASTPLPINQLNQDPYLNDEVLRVYNRLDLSLLAGTCCKYYPRGMCTEGEISGILHGQNPASTEVPAQAAEEFVGRKAVGSVGEQAFPEKILTRSNGVNSVRSLKSVSASDSLLPHHANSNGSVYSNVHGVQSLAISNRSLHLDGQNNEASSPENSDLRHISRMTHMKYNSLDEVVGRINSMAKDQHGCRFLQEMLTEGAPQDVAKIFVEIIDHIVELMTDPFGNYLVQKLLNVCNEDQRICILHETTKKAGELIDISCNMHGTRAVQKVIETLKTPEQFSIIVSSLKSGIVQLMKDVNGNHVAQRCLQHLTPKYCKFLFDAAVAHCLELATDRQGCCVLQKCLNHSDGEHKEHLMSEITSNALVLAQDKFGNYVVQYVLDLKYPHVTAQVLNQLRGNYGDLSMQKFSSNVVEKCLKVSGDDEQIKIVQELMDSPHFLRLLQDPYGNYVMQSALRECKGALHSTLVEAIRPHVSVLRTSTYGKKVLSRKTFRK